MFWVGKQYTFLESAQKWPLTAYNALLRQLGKVQAGD